MLNLSDKELDRLSKEAAQEYDPGDVLGPNTWEKLQVRLDTSPGRGSPNPLRHIRRWPFYYAPALLVLLGISYYYLTKHPPSPDRLAKTVSSSQISNHTANSTPAVPSSAQPVPSEATGSGRQGGTGNEASHVNGRETPAAGTAVSNKGANKVAGRNAVVAAEGNSSSKAAKSDGGGASPKAIATGGSGSIAGSAGNAVGTGSRSRQNGKHALRGAGQLSGNGGVMKGNRGDVKGNSSGLKGDGGGLVSNGGALTGSTGDRTSGASSSAGNGMSAAGKAGTETAPELVRSTVQGPIPTERPGYIDDSALRAFTLRSTPPPPIRERALYIKRNWQFGFVLAPDFASVNSLAGDKPGSIMGVTADYQFAPRWYIGSGLLIDRKNYAARSEDFHAPQWYFASNNIDPKHVDFYKGSFSMLEIPLNLRYDFSVTGNTLFFASAGVSSYLLATDNGNCYYNLFGPEFSKGFQNTNPSNYLFSTANLSVGVETGISNSLSMVVAPYWKMPLGSMGFGQVQMSSVGINFSLKWAPVTSSRRR